MMLFPKQIPPVSRTLLAACAYSTEAASLHPSITGPIAEHETERYQRGTVNKSTGRARLCSTRSGFLELPEHYSPRYLLFESCTDDTRCLSGFGSCSTQIGNQAVYNMQTRSSESLPIAGGCDCQVIGGSTLHNFISSR
jgi:hypothetical protein